MIHVIMAVAGIGALASGLIFTRRSRRIAMLLICIAVSEAMLFILGERLDWGIPECFMMGFLGGFFLAFVGNRLRRPD